MVNWKTRLIAVEVSVSTRKTRASSVGGRSTCFGARFDGDASSRGATRAKMKPQAIDTSPGTTNALRQPKYLTSSPVESAAAAMPRLPASPLTPITRPGVSVVCTSIGMPTGW